MLTLLEMKGLSLIRCHKEESLRKIALVANKIGIIGAEAIKEALDVNTLLEEVEIFSNYKIGNDLKMEIGDKVLRNKALNTILKGSLEEIEEVIGRSAASNS